jgi:hypothetical protein
MWKEAALAYFKILFKNILEELRKTTKQIIGKYTLSPG